MKDGTKLGLMFVGAGVASNLLLANTVSSYTSSYAMPAAAAEGVGALGGGYYAWKKKSAAGAIIGGALAGLLVASARAMISTPAAGSSAPQSQAPPTSTTLPNATLPTPAVGQGPGTPLLLPNTTSTLPGFTSRPGQVPMGSVVPAANRPASAADVQAYANQAAQTLQDATTLLAQQASTLQQGGLPIAMPLQSGAVVRVGMVKPPKRGGFGAGATMRRGY